MARSDEISLKRVTMRDVAAAAQVPVSAVALAMADKPGVSSRRRAAVLRAAEELGYERANRPMKATYGLLMEELSPAARSDGFIDTLLQGVYAGARASHAQIVLCMYHQGGDAVAELTELAGRRPDGLIIANGGDITAEVIAQVMASGLPCVLLENRIDDPVPSVSSDNFGAGLEATRHLLDLGHRRIGLVKGSERYASLRDRARGYMVALAEAGLEVDHELIVAQPEHVEHKGYDQTKALLDLSDRPTALYAVSDKNAFGALAAIAEAGLIPGQDISVVGTDNVEGSAYNVPALTTFDTKSQLLGRAALRTLSTLASGDELVTHSVVQGELVVRATTGPVRRARR